MVPVSVSKKGIRSQEKINSGINKIEAKLLLKHFGRKLAPIWVTLNFTKKKDSDQAAIVKLEPDPLCEPYISTANILSI